MMKDMQGDIEKEKKKAEIDSKPGYAMRYLCAKIVPEAERLERVRKR
jgi:hypothetical protein